MLQSYSAEQTAPGESRHTYSATLLASQNPCRVSLLVLLDALDCTWDEGNNLGRAMHVPQRHAPCLPHSRFHVPCCLSAAALCGVSYCSHATLPRRPGATLIGRDYTDGIAQ